MPWNVPVFDSDGKVKDARIFMPPVLSATGIPLINEVTASGVSSTKITNQELRDLGFLLVDDFAGVDPTGATDSIVGMNLAALDANSMEKCLWFSADGIYTISDTFKCGIWKGRGIGNDSLHMVGGGGDGAVGARPRIVLEPDATGFGSGEHPVVAWRQFRFADFGDWPSDAMNHSTPYEGQSNQMKDSQFENIDIDCGGNAGAFGLFAPLAQRCYFGEITITATGAAGGYWGPGGRQSMPQNIKIIGGGFQIRAGAKGLSGGGSGGCTIAGLTLIGDAGTTVPIDADDFVPLTIVGFDITQTNSNPIWTADSNPGTGDGILVMIDGKIDTGGGTVFSNSRGHTCYFRNVYVTGTDDLIKSDAELLISEIGTWKRINEYVYNDQTSEDAPNDKYDTFSLIDGSITQTPEPATDTEPSVSAPSVDFVARHSITLPHADSGPFINIEDHGAVGVPFFDDDLFDNNLDNTTQDSRADIQAAITAATAAGHNTVFVPRGSFYVGSPGLVLDPNTIFIGTCPYRSQITTHGSWQPTSKVYVVRSADDANGTAHWSNVGINTRTKDGTGGGTSIPFQFDHFSYLEWRTGKNSSAVHWRIGKEFQTGSHWCQPKDGYAFSGNAGGKHYSLSGNTGRNFGNPDCRAVRITSIVGPLHLYGLNHELSTAGAPDATINNEITDSSNIRIYGNKREGHGASTRMLNCDNIALYGYGRQVESDANTYVTKIEGSSTNILIAVAVVDQGDKDVFRSGGRGNPEQDVDSPSGVVEIVFPDGCSIYKLGTIDDAAVTI